MTIHFKKRRYLCTSCHHTFYEKLSFVGRYQRHTHSLEQRVMTYVGYIHSLQLENGGV